MKVLFITNCRDGIPLALRVKQEGNDVITYVEKPEDDPEQYSGIAKQTDDLDGKIKWCDYAVFDYNHNLTAARRKVHKAKKPAYNAVHTQKDITIAGKTYKPWDFLLAMEDERAWGHAIMEHFGIGKKVQRWEFNDTAKAMEFVKKQPGRYVIKIEGDAPSDAIYLGITDDGEDVVRYLDTYPERAEHAKVKKIELEKFIEGIEIGCGGHFSRGWMGKDINFEHKKFRETPYSFLTGEMGTLIKMVDKHKLFDETLGKMTEFLTEIDFRGNIDINGILNKDGFYPSEFTTGRFGYPAVYIEMEGRLSAWGTFLGAGAKGIPLKFTYNPNWLIGVVIAGKGYPFYKEVGAEKMKYMPVIIENPEVVKHVQLCDVRYMKGGIYTTNAYVGCATAAGRTIQEAQQKVYDILPQIKVPYTDYRADIGDRVIKQMAELKKMGYGL